MTEIHESLYLLLPAAAAASSQIFAGISRRRSLSRKSVWCERLRYSAKVVLTRRVFLVRYFGYLRRWQAVADAEAVQFGY